MSRSTCDEYLEKMRCRYRRYTGKPAKSRLLDEFRQVTGYERKHAIKLLGGRPRTYAPETESVVFEIWKHSEQPCGKRLKPMLAQWLPFYEKRCGDRSAKTSARACRPSAPPNRSAAGTDCRRQPEGRAQRVKSTASSHRGKSAMGQSTGEPRKPTRRSRRRSRRWYR